MVSKNKIRKTIISNPSLFSRYKRLWTYYHPDDLLDLTGINLSKVDLTQIDLSYTCLKGANFSNSNLHLTDFSNSIISFSCFNNAKNLHTVTLDSSVAIDCDWSNTIPTICLRILLSKTVIW